jgi:hypothetical protein
MLKRSKLPKDPVLTHCPGMKMKKDEYYEPKDLVLGNKIQIFGRSCLIFNCDDFTKAWFKETLTIDMIPIELSKPRPLLKHDEVPPYLGYGSQEDSLASVKSLIMKPPKKDVQKIFKNDLHILRFEGKLVSANPDDENRNFIVSFYCGDDTIKVQEVAERNSGRIGGKFLDRNKQVNPISSQFYTEKDMVLGNLVLLGGYKFRLVQCDEYTQKYYEVTFILL